jgi:CrcB protein
VTDAGRSERVRSRAASQPAAASPAVGLGTATAARRAAVQSRSAFWALQGAIAVGGAIGALARVGVARVVDTGPPSWPWSTLLVNLLGCFLLGYFATRLLERLPPSTYLRPLLGTGLCGALTTFSTLQVEVIELVRAGRPIAGAAYLVVTVAGCLGAVYAATKLVRRARGPA